MDQDILVRFVSVRCGARARGRGKQAVSVWWRMVGMGWAGLGWRFGVVGRVIGGLEVLVGESGLGRGDGTFWLWGGVYMDIFLWVLGFEVWSCFYGFAGMCEGFRYSLLNEVV